MKNLTKAIYILFRYYLLNFFGAAVLVTCIVLIRMLFDIVIPEPDGRSLSLLVAQEWEIVLVIIFIISFLYGSWQLYGDMILIPRKFKQELVSYPLNQLEKHGFVFDGDYFKSAIDGYLVLISYYWLDDLRPKGNFVVGVLFNHQKIDKDERAEKSNRLNQKYRDHEPPILFYENFAYRLFPKTTPESFIEVETLLKYSDSLIQVLKFEGLPAFPPELISQSMKHPVKIIFKELDGLL